MVDGTDNGSTTTTASQGPAVDHLRSALKEGRDWATALFESMALWTAPTETFRGRTYTYFIAGEAFDWLVLAERLCREVKNLLPRQEKEDLLFVGCFPPSFNTAKIRDILGVDKYRGYLNFYYGVTVEEALQLAAELEVLKRYASNGVQYKDDCSEEAFRKVYLTSKTELLAAFRQERRTPPAHSMSLGESKEFTYWLFKYRLRISDKAKIASDTQKGLEQLQRMRKAARSRDGPPLVAHGAYVDAVRPSM